MQESDVKKIVADHLCKLAGEPSLEGDINIVETGLVNSLATIQIVSFLEKNFQVKVGIDDLDMANFSSINAICDFLGRKQVQHA